MKTKMKNPQKTQKPLRLLKGSNTKTQITQKPLPLPTLPIHNDNYHSVNAAIQYVEHTNERTKRDNF